MTKKLLTVALTIAACAALWGAVCPQSASGGKVSAFDQVTSTAAVAQEEHTGALSLSAAEKEHAPAEETNLPLPTEAPEPAPVMAEPQPPAAPLKETAAPEAKPAQTPESTTSAPQPAQNPQPKQPQPSADPAPGERRVAGGKAQVWVPGFGWVEDGGGKGPSQIARILTNEQIVNPSNQYYQETGAAVTGLDTTRPYTWVQSTIKKMLENPVYIGHTLSMQKTTLSYKNKKAVYNPESEQVLVKNTHEPLISQEIWNIVQEVRQHKRRAPKHMEEPNLFSGLVYCADCGKYLVLCRTEKMREDQYYFRCSTYGKRGKSACTPHQLREMDLKQIVLDDLRRVTHFARMKERQFAAYINRKNTMELRREINALQKDVDVMRRRSGELSALFKRLYEDNVLGRVTNEQFRMLSSDYNAEQKALEEAIPEKESRLENLKASAANVDAFIEKAKRYTTIDELTPELLRLFIQRIEVGERGKKHSHSSGQSIRIIYRDIGTTDSAMDAAEQQPHIAAAITSKDDIIRLLA